MREPIPSEFLPHDQPKNTHQRIHEIDRLLAIDESSDSDHTYEIYAMLEELDETTGLGSGDVLFSGQGLLVTFDEEGPSESQAFDVESMVGASLGFEVWESPDRETGKVYLTLSRGAVEYNDDGERISGSIYFLDPFDSSITPIDASFDEIMTDIVNPAMMDDGTSLDRVIDLVARYERMVTSARFKKLDDTSKTRAADRFLTQLNSCIASLGKTISLPTEKAYLCDLFADTVIPREYAGNVIEARGEPAAFVSLRSIMPVPELHLNRRRDQLCLALVPDAYTMHATQADTNQLIFVPVKKGTEITEALLLNYQNNA